jgi:hypothetical protein
MLSPLLSRDPEGEADLEPQSRRQSAYSLTAVAGAEALGEASGTVG